MPLTKSSKLPTPPEAITGTLMAAIASAGMLALPQLARAHSAFGAAGRGVRDLERRLISTSVIGRVALLDSKRAAGRYKDLADVEALESVDDEPR